MGDFKPASQLDQRSQEAFRNSVSNAFTKFIQTNHKLTLGKYEIQLFKLHTTRDGERAILAHYQGRGSRARSIAEDIGARIQRIEQLEKDIQEYSSLLEGTKQEFRTIEKKASGILREGAEGILSKSDLELFEGIAGVEAGQGAAEISQEARAIATSAAEKLGLSEKTAATITRASMETEEFMTIRRCTSWAGNKMAAVLQNTLKKLEPVQQRVSFAIEQFNHGYSRLAEEALQMSPEFMGLEASAGFWKRLQGVSQKYSEQEISELKTGIQSIRLNVAEGEQLEEMAALFRRLNAPSYRVWLGAKSELVAIMGDMADIYTTFQEVREASLLGRVSAVGKGVGKSLRVVPMSALRGTRAAVKATVSTLYTGLEAAVGVQQATVAVAGFETALEGFVACFEIALSFEAMAGIIFVDLLASLIHNGFSIEFLDTILGFFFLDHNMFITPRKRMEQYPMHTKRPHDAHGSEKHTFEKLNELHYKELKYTMDYWGAVFIDMLKGQGKETTDYVPMKNYSSENLIPGRYMYRDPSRNPEPEDALAINLRVEEEMKHKADSKLFGNDMHLVDKYIRKPTYPERDVKNYQAFRTADGKIQWPDIEKGVNYVTNGDLRKGNVHEYIWGMFEHWVRTGEWGDAFNYAKTAEEQAEFAKANREDFENYIHMKQPKHLKWTEINVWLNSAAGKMAARSFSPSNFAPDLFLHEWNNDPTREDTIKYGMKGEWGNTENRMQQKYEMYEGTLTEVQDYYDVFGRYMYFPRFRKIYAILAEAFQHVRHTHDPNYYKHKVYKLEIYTGVLGAIEYIERKTVPLDWAASFNHTNPYMQEGARVHREGLEMYKKMVELKSKTEEEWNKYLFSKLWELYRENQKHTRSIHSYIRQQEVLLIENMHYLISYYNHSKIGEIWDDWLRFKQFAGIPLDIDQMERVRWGARFALLAYSEVGDQEDKRQADTQKRLKEHFGETREYIISSHKDYGTADLAAIFLVPEKAEQTTIADLLDKLKVFGDLRCRVTVTQDPCNVFVSFRGTSNFFEMQIDGDFCIASVFSASEVHKHGIDVQIPGVKFGNFSLGKTTAEELVYGEKYCKVHRGFARAFEYFNDTLKTLLLSIYKSQEADGNPVQGLHICGHSLGGAIAQVAALFLPRPTNPNKMRRASLIQFKTALGGKLAKEEIDAQPQFLQPNVYTYGSPRVGDSRFAELFGTITNEVVHTANPTDIIPLLPPFLVIDKTTHEEAYKTSGVLVKNFYTANPEEMSIWQLVSNVFANVKLPTFSADFSVWPEKGTKTKLFNIFATLVYGASQGLVQRGAGTFITLPANEKKAYYSHTEQSAMKLVGALMNTVSAFDIDAIKTSHGMANILDQLDYLTIYHRHSLSDGIREETPTWKVPSGEGVNKNGLTKQAQFAFDNHKIPPKLAHNLRQFFAYERDITPEDARDWGTYMDSLSNAVEERNKQQVQANRKRKRGIEVA